MPNDGNTVMLRDLGDLVTSTKSSVLSFTKPAEFGLSPAFADALIASFPDYAFEFYERTLRVRTPARQYIYVSGQSFALAECLMDYCEEIGRYRALAYQILRRYSEQLADVAHGDGRLEDRVFTSLRDKDNPQLLTAFKTRAKTYFSTLSDGDEELASRNTDYLMKFLTDYNWWLGGKQISRSNDWSISPISTLLNMPQNDSNFIARVVSKATEDAGFREAFKQAIEHEWTQEADVPDVTDHGAATATSVAENILLYGVPGCGKSHTIKTEYCNDDEHMERAVFHPDYTYSDFVGQILPKVDEGRVEYRFEPGPFTRILKKAIETPTDSFYLVVEEINRGNAPAIFGDVFQLLDRDENGQSEYGVSNENIANYVYGNATTKIKIPNNLYVLATMNTSDQNVFTLDTAFKRRWTMRMIENNIDACEFANHQICAWNITWGAFAKAINQKIIELGENNLSNEDNRLGAYFVRALDLRDAERFGEKVLMYLWNDAFKFNHDKVFKAEYRTLDELISGFIRQGFAVFSDEIAFDAMETTPEETFETDSPTIDQYLEGKNPDQITAYRTLFAAVVERIPNAYDGSVGSLNYAAWKANDIRKASFADVRIRRDRIIIQTEIPTDNSLLAAGRQLPVDNHHNHYFEIIYSGDVTEQVVSIIVDSYNQLRVQ